MEAPTWNAGRTGVWVTRQVSSTDLMWWGRLLWPFLSLATVLWLWVLALPNIDPTAMDDLGLVSVLPPAFFVAFLLLIVSFSFLVLRQPERTWILVLHVILLIVMIHGTPALTYETLRYSWAWKHVGIVDYIQRYGSVNPADQYFGAYHNWPGFFALSALFTEASGFASALSFAHWAPVFFNLFNLAALLLIIKSLTRDQRLISLSIWFYFLTNWVGQDYFSPQAFSYSLHLLLLGICLTWFKATQKNGEHVIPFLSRFDPAAFLPRKLSGSEEAREIGNLRSQPLVRVGLLQVVILLMTVIVFTHQLTPFMTIFSLSALVMARRLGPRGLPVLMAVLTMTWLGYVAVSFVQDSVETVVATAARLVNNTQATLIDVSQVSEGQVLVAMIGRGLTAFMIGLAFLGSIRRFACGQRDLTAILLMASPLAALAISSYEGEMVFRVYLFSLPFLAFFAAASVLPRPTSGTSALTLTILIMLSGILLGGFLFSHFGKDRQYHFTRNEFEASQFLYDTAPVGSLLIEGTPNYPTRFKNYETFTYVPISREPLAGRLHLIDHPVESLSRWMSNDSYPAAYLIITRGQKAEVDALGIMPPGSLDRIEQALKQSPQFRVVYSNPDASIFVLNNNHDRGTP